MFTFTKIVRLYLSRFARTLFTFMRKRPSFQLVQIPKVKNWKCIRKEGKTLFLICVWFKRGGNPVGKSYKSVMVKDNRRRNVIYSKNT